MIILGGYAAIEEAARKAGIDIKTDFKPGRVDAIENQIEVDFYKAIEPFADGFRNYFKNPESIDEDDIYTTPEYFLVDKANLLKLTVPEMVALVGGLMVLGATYQYDKAGVLTENPETLTNDFFVNILDMNIEWRPEKYRYIFYGYDRKDNKPKWKATRVDLALEHHEELRAVSEVYASEKEIFINNFIY